MSPCYGCYDETRAVSHPKPHDGGDHVTDVTDVTANEEGVYVTGVRRRPRSLAAYSRPPLKQRNIRNIRNTPRAVRRFCVSHRAVTPASGVTSARGSGVSA